MADRQDMEQLVRLFTAALKNPNLKGAHFRAWVVSDAEQEDFEQIARTAGPGKLIPVDRRRRG